VAGEGRRSGERESDPDPGVMLRPEALVLADDAMVPDKNVIQPAPNRFTHELMVDEPYRFDRSEHAGENDGVFPAGTLVVLLVEGPDRSRVVDGRGLYVDVRRASLRKLPDT
jgi:hypothetical protein